MASSLPHAVQCLPTVAIVFVIVVVAASVLIAVQQPGDVAAAGEADGHKLVATSGNDVRGDGGGGDGANNNSKTIVIIMIAVVTSAS